MRSITTGKYYKNYTQKCVAGAVPGVTAHTLQSIGLPTALPGLEEAARGLSPSPLVPLAHAER